MDEDIPDYTDDESAEQAAYRAVQTLERFLREDGWHPQQEGEGEFAAQFVGDHEEYHCHFHIDSELQQFYCYILAPERVPETERVAMSEFLTRANYGLVIGNFEMDFEEGEVRYKSSLDFEGEELTDNWLRNAIYPAVYTMDRYWPGLDMVSTGASPEEAIDEVEE